jgi:hypothetical protein
MTKSAHSAVATGDKIRLRAKTKRPLHMEVAATARSLATCGKQMKKKYIAIDLGSEEVMGGQQVIANV